MSTDTARPAARRPFWPADTAEQLAAAPSILSALLGPAPADGETWRRIYSYGDDAALALELERGPWLLTVPALGYDSHRGPTLTYRGDGGPGLELAPGCWRGDLAELARLLAAVAQAPALRPIAPPDLPDLAPAAGREQQIERLERQIAELDRQLAALQATD